MISVITSCYNSKPEYLKESILSILNQTYQDFELLVASNGVSFFMPEFLAQFNDPRIKYIDNGGNIGPTASYDNLAELAKGEYVAIQDHDDVSLPERLDIEKAALDADKSVKSVSGLITINGKIDGQAMELDQVKEKLIFWQPIKHPTFMKRKQFCRECKYISKYRYCYDYEFWSRTRDIPHRILGDVLLKYRKWSGNNGQVRNTSLRTEHALIVQRNLAQLGIDAPIELCQALDPFNHNPVDYKIAYLFTTIKDRLLKHISAELYERKLQELQVKHF